VVFNGTGTSTTVLGRLQGQTDLPNMQFSAMMENKSLWGPYMKSLIDQLGRTSTIPKAYTSEVRNGYNSIAANYGSLYGMRRQGLGLTGTSIQDITLQSIEYILFVINMRTLRVGTNRTNDPLDLFMDPNQDGIYDNTIFTALNEAHLKPVVHSKIKDAIKSKGFSDPGVSETTYEFRTTNTSLSLLSSGQNIQILGSTHVFVINPTPELLPFLTEHNPSFSSVRGYPIYTLPNSEVGIVSIPLNTQYEDRLRMLDTSAISNATMQMPVSQGIGQPYTLTTLQVPIAGSLQSQTVLGVFRGTKTDRYTVEQIGVDASGNRLYGLFARGNLRRNDMGMVDTGSGVERTVFGAGINDLGPGKTFEEYLLRGLEVKEQELDPNIRSGLIGGIRGLYSQAAAIADMRLPDASGNDTLTFSQYFGINSQMNDIINSDIRTRRALLASSGIIQSTRSLFVGGAMTGSELSQQFSGVREVNTVTSSGQQVASIAGQINESDVSSYIQRADPNQNFFASFSQTSRGGQPSLTQEVTPGSELGQALTQGITQPYSSDIFEGIIASDRFKALPEAKQKIIRDYFRSIPMN
jgi:hypothetical protein